MLIFLFLHYNTFKSDNEIDLTQLLRIKRNYAVQEIKFTEKLPTFVTFLNINIYIYICILQYISMRTFYKILQTLKNRLVLLQSFSSFELSNIAIHIYV